MIQGLTDKISFMDQEIIALKHSQIIQNEHIVFMEKRFAAIPTKCSRKSARKWGYHCYYIPPVKKNWYNAEH